MKKKNDVQNRVMKKTSQKNVQKVEKDFEIKKRSRFIFDKEKIKIIKKIKNVKKVEKIVSLSTRKKISNKFRIIDI
jgi:hypothetical protein